MNHDLLLNNARWDIVKAISQGRASATELAKVTKSSLPNVSQQMKLLEAYDLVEYIKDQRQSQGKPRQLFALKRELCHITFARPGFADKRFFNPDSYHTMILNICFLPSMQDHPYLHKFLFNDELLHCAIAYLKSNDTEIELLILTENLEGIRAKYSNTYVEYNGKPRKIICWTHNLHELQEGVNKKEPYFEHLMQHITLHDPKAQFEKIKRR